MNYRDTGNIGCSLICFVLLHYRVHQSIRIENQVWFFTFRQGFAQFGIVLMAFSISKVRMSESCCDDYLVL